MIKLNYFSESDQGIHLTHTLDHALWFISCTWHADVFLVLILFSHTSFGDSLKLLGNTSQPSLSFASQYTHTWCRSIKSLISVVLKRPTISSNTAICLWWSQQGIVGPQPYWFVTDCLKHHNKGKQNVTYLSSQDQAGEQRLLMSEALSDITPMVNTSRI